MPRGDALQLGGGVRRQHRQGARLGERSGHRAVQHRHRAASAKACTISTSWSSTIRTRRRCTCRCRTRRRCSSTCRRSRRRSFRSWRRSRDVPDRRRSARGSTGLSRVGARTAIALALGNGPAHHRARGSAEIKKELIERECQGLLEFVESPFTLDHVAGHRAVKSLAARGRRAAASGARCARCRWAT